MPLKKFNWAIWAALLLSLIAFISYFSFFVWFPVTRDFPWVNLILFGLALFLLVIGVRRAFSADRPHPTRSKIAGSVAALLSIAILAFFLLTFFVAGRQLPSSHGAPQVSQKAPDFTLSDTTDKPVSLSALLSSPVNGKAPKGVLLVFYRGYW